MSLTSQLRLRFASLPVVLSLFGALACPDSLFAQWSDSAQANDPIVVLRDSRQFSPAIARDGSNGAIIAWTDDRNGNLDVFGQRIDEAGKLIWANDGLPIAVAAAEQEAPFLLAGEGGTVFVAWQDNRSFPAFKEIWAQNLDGDGGSLWPQPTKAHSGNNFRPVLLSGSSEGIITASYTRSTNDFISVQKIDATGQNVFSPQRIVSLSATGQQPDQPPAVVAALGGGVMATWAETRLDRTVVAKGLLGSGDDWSAGKIVLSQDGKPETFPVAIPDGEEGAIIAWIEPLPSLEDDAVKATRLDRTGGSVWEPAIVAIAGSVGRKSGLRMAADGQNGAYLVWQNQVDESSKLQAQRITGRGQSWPGGLAPTDLNSAQFNSEIMASDGGSAIVVWEDTRNGETDIYTQLIDSSGVRGWGQDGVAVSTATGGQHNPVLVADGLGGAIVAWEDFRGGPAADVYVQRVSVTGVLGEFRTIAIAAPISSSDWEIGSAQHVRWTVTAGIEEVSLELSRDGGVSYETLFDALPITNQDDAQVVVENVSGPASNACKIRISAVNAEFILAESALFRISNPQGPALDAQVISRATANDSLQVTTTANDISGIQQVSLNYKKGGALSFSSAPMLVADTDRFEGAIPASFVTERGVVYFISGTDSLGLASYSDTLFVTVDFAEGVQTKEVSRGSHGNSYRMFSSPNLLDEPNVENILRASGFGAYDTTSWRLFDFRNDEYVERSPDNASSFAFTTGKAYWLISSEERTIDFGAGQSIRADRDAPLSLTPGWNQVGLPFAFPVAWSDISSVSEVPNISRPFLYQGDFQLPDQLEPYRGYFVFNYDSVDVELKIPPVESQSSRAVERRGEATEPDWELRITAQCQQAQDNINTIGIHRQALQAWDPRDLPEPPPIGDFIAAYFPRNEWHVQPINFTTDYRGELGAGQSWDFEVRTNIPNDEAKVTVAGIEALPSGYEAFLLDEKLLIRQDLREDAVYTFPTGPGGVTKTLRLVIGTSAYLVDETAASAMIPDRFELAQNFPNPFNPTTAIRYGLPRGSRVRLQVFDLLGRAVTTLVDSEYRDAGFHIETWNGRDQSGRSIASGVYLYRLSTDSFSQSRKMVLVK